MRKKANESDNREEKKEKKKAVAVIIILAAILVFILLCFRSCRARDEPLEDILRVYEENAVPEGEEGASAEKNMRLNLAVSEHYQISDKNPLFYIGYPEDNVFDVVFTFLNENGEKAYQTDYVAPGINVAVDGTGFLKKGANKVDCLVTVYDHDSGMLVSECTTIVLNVNYK